jgi:hypothetical protein
VGNSTELLRLTGVNERGISIGQVGAETAAATFRGEPFSFIMRRVMEEAGDVDAAATIITSARRTVGINYVIADAAARRAITMETNHQHAAVFQADDPAEHQVPYARPIPDAVFRADTAIDPHIRERQIASGGKPRRPGLEPPTGSAYTTRYLGQAAGLLAYYGEIDAQTARRIAEVIAPGSNIQSVVFAWPNAWVADAQGTTRASMTLYHELNVQQLLDQGAAAPAGAVEGGAS